MCGTRKRPIVKVDIDGVLRDMVSVLCELYGKKTGETITPSEVCEYDVNKTFTGLPVSADDYFFRVDENIDAVCDAPIYPSAPIALPNLHMHGFDVVIVTKQVNERMKIRTFEWLKKHGFTIYPICFVDDKSIVRGDYLIDDNPYELTNAEEGVTPLRIIRPYNNHLSHILGFNNIGMAAQWIINQHNGRKD